MTTYVTQNQLNDGLFEERGSYRLPHRGYNIAGKSKLTSLIKSELQKFQAATSLLFSQF